METSFTVRKMADVLSLACATFALITHQIEKQKELVDILLISFELSGVIAVLNDDERNTVNLEVLN